MIKNKVCYFNNRKYRLEIIDNKVYINGVSLDLLDHGVDGFVYKFKDKAIKLYREDKLIKSHLNQEQISILSSITTDHIVLPREKLIGDNNPGYIMKYINIEKKKDFLLESKAHIVKELKELEDELILLGKNHFLLGDMQESNIFYNGKLYLFDSDSFVYDKKANFSRRNLELFSWYFMRDVLFSLKTNSIEEKEQLGFVRKLHYLYQKGKYTSIAEFLEDYMYEENLKEFSKNIKKEKIVSY